MSETEATQKIDHIIGMDSLRIPESQLVTQISSLIGRRTLEVVKKDASFDPDSYDPAFDEDNFAQMAA